MKSKDLMKKLKATAPKTWALMEKRWDTKMIGPVMDFTMSILGDINPRLKKLARKDEYLINGADIEERLWKLLAKARRLK